LRFERAAFQDQSEHKADQTDEQSINRQWIEQHVNVFRLLQITEQGPYHNLPCHWVPETWLFVLLDSASIFASQQS